MYCRFLPNTAHRLDVAGVRIWQAADADAAQPPPCLHTLLHVYPYARLPAASFPLLLRRSPFSAGS